jgi:hypothetical protein
MNFLISLSRFRYPWAGFPVRQAHFPAPDNAEIGTAQPLTSDNQISSHLAIEPSGDQAI